MSGECLGPCLASTARSPPTSEQNRGTPRRCRRFLRRPSWRKAFLTSSGRRYRVRPKLLAIEVSGCHLVPVIVQASGRGRQARAGGHGQRDVTQPQDLGMAGAAGSRWPSRPDTVTGPGSGGQAGESPGSGDNCSPAWSKTAKGDLAVKHRRGIQTRSHERRRVSRPMAGMSVITPSPAGIRSG